MATKKAPPKSYNFKYRGYKLLFRETKPDRVDWSLEDPKGHPCGIQDTGFDVTQTQAIASAKDCVDMIIDGDTPVDDDSDATYEEEDD